MNQEEALDRLKGYVKFCKNGNGAYQAKKDGVTITIHTNGKIQYQGKSIEKIKEEVDEILGQETTGENNKQLFIVYGHDKIAKEQLETILEKLDIKTNQVTNNTGMTIIEALENEISRVHAGIVLLTPDDISLSKKDYEEHKSNFDGYIHVRARQNVILEMGMIMGKLGRQNTIILAKGDVEIPSDIEGVFRLQFKEHPKEILTQLTDRLKDCGFSINSDNIINAIR